MSVARSVFAALALLAAAASAAPPAFAQTPPSAPGRTNPNPAIPPVPGAKTIVVNPTIEECRRGWSAGTQWTKDQLDKFCAEISQSK